MKRRRPEDAIRRAVFQHLAARSTRGVFAFHLPNGGWRSPIEAAVLRGLGIVPGIPDLILKQGGETFALEIKAPGGRLSSAQRETHDRLRAAGATVAAAVGLDEALTILQGWELVRGRLS
jgi:hypothetical protein